MKKNSSLSATPESPAKTRKRSSNLKPTASGLTPGQTGIKLDSVIAETASGLNDRRPELRKILRNPEVGTVIVEHRDRLARFGTDMVDSMLQARGGRLIVINDQEIPDDLVRDMTEILTCFCARLYGKRSAANRAAKALQASQQQDDDAQKAQ